MINRGDQGEIDKFNKLLQTYQDCIDPSIAEKREDLQDKFDAMSDLFGDTAGKVPRMKITSVEPTDTARTLSVKKNKK